MRASGILLHISSLPSDYGIGTIGQAAFDFVDFLHTAGQRFWQVLPLGPTSYGDSPYQSFSTFAGNPYFIDLDLLTQDGLLEKQEYEGIDWGDDPACTDYEKLYKNRFSVLRRAFERGFARDEKAVAEFRRRQGGWLEDYALFMALKDRFGGRAWSEWDDGLRLREPGALERARLECAEDLDFWVYVQYLFFTQWFALKTYANKNGVELIGDLPIYVAADSADVWAHPELFWLDEDRKPVFIAGVPPDYFSPDGQLWGNPLYDWKVHEETGYHWWIERIRMVTSVCDMVRIDHFRGFAGFYAVPFGDADAKGGHWEKGPGRAVFAAAEKELGKSRIIAEDLGILTDDVYELLRQTGFPGMKILQFAFDSNWDNVYLPHNHVRHSVIYTGTHDNDTLMHWWETALAPQDRQHAADYMRLNESEGVNWGILHTVWASVAELAVAPIQDFLALGGEARMNTPSTLGGNWQFRLQKGMLTRQLAEKIERMSGLYQRSTL
ncbi:4-alpha-glucanotransferase [Anaerotruncus rubiinfantis]|uniref:4-alpha-glucanotransferase n=1 Tax=Anaerotruncus rubiinfantis TaxID=1720200 RepID=UPI0011C9298E|nr:4-alpha-glucanotransferase [Anaerotruncus rubiinfantis]